MNNKNLEKNVLVFKKISRDNGGYRLDVPGDTPKIDFFCRFLDGIYSLYRAEFPYNIPVHFGNEHSLKEADARLYEIAWLYGPDYAQEHDLAFIDKTFQEEIPIKEPEKVLAT